MPKRTPKKKMSLLTRLRLARLGLSGKLPPNPQGAILVTSDDRRSKRDTRALHEKMERPLYRILNVPDKANTIPDFRLAPLNKSEFDIKETKRYTSTVPVSIKESDVGMATTTPILGQYSSYFGWPDDWAWLWEYLNVWLLVPEAKFSVLLKNNMIWRNSWDIEGPDDKVADEIEQKIRKTNFERVFRELTKDAIWAGTAYAEKVDDSKVTWVPGNASVSGTMYVSNVQPKNYKPPTELYGFKQLDPRTVRVEVDPNHFDRERGEPTILKFVQRRWQGPLAMPATQPPLYDAIMNTEMYFTKEQMVCIRFNRKLGGIYGRSAFSEVYWALKAYLVMIQYIPAIFAKRADPLLLFKFGAEIINEMGTRYTKYPRDETEFNISKSRVLNRAPAEDLFSDIMTSVEEVYKTQGNLRGLEALHQVWKERIMMGLGIPPVLSETRVSAVRWGDVKAETLIDEIKVDQFEVEDVVNRNVMGYYTKDVKDGDQYHFKYNEVKPEDRLALMRAALPVVQFGGANWKWYRKEVGIPEQYAKGAAPMIGLSANPQAGGIGGFTSDPNRIKSPNAHQPKAGDDEPKIKSPPAERPKKSAPNPTGKRGNR